MPHQELEPPESLRDVVKCFWYIHNDFGTPESVFEVMPDGSVEIIFHFGTLSRIAPDGGHSPLPSPFLVGLLQEPVRFLTTNPLEVIGVRCYPWTVFDLLGLPSGKERVRSFEHPVAQLQPLLEADLRAGDVAGALLRAQHYFLTARTRVPVDSLLAKAGAALQEEHGTLPVNQVAAAAHASVRTLERKFKQSSGHTVKDISGAMRFEETRDRLWRDPDVGLAGLAAELGYADQPHLTREFKRYSGVTPAAFIRNAKRKKRMFLDDFVAFIQA